MIDRFAKKIFTPHQEQLIIFSMMATKLSSALVAPSKVANLLDWRKAVGSVLSLDITCNRIGIAIAEHPDQTTCESRALRPISFLPPQDYRDTTPPPPVSSSSSSLHNKKNQVDIDAVTQQLESIVRTHRVCAFIVNWPIHEGRMGGDCGKVLQVLDSVIERSNSVVTRKRPFTLWCNHEKVSSYDSSSLSIDEWGRSASFARAPAYYPGMRYSSKTSSDDQIEETVYNDDDDTSFDASRIAANLLDEWVNNHWDINKRDGRAMSVKNTSVQERDFFFSTHSVDEYNSEKACLQSALL